MNYELRIKNQKNGYTIIETMIAIALFLIIITIGMGALLNANLIHRKSQDMRSILDNLSFIMEDMSRNIRTGSEYQCIIGVNPTIDNNCLGRGNGISFKSSDGSSQWIYNIGTNFSNTANYSIYKKTPNDIVPIQLTPDEVKIDYNASGFTVFGANPKTLPIIPTPASLNGNVDSEQPFVIIRLSGVITYKGVDSPFSLQTSVSQRLIDF